VEPKVLLLDEPFGALDAKVRQELRQWLRRLHEEIHVTSVFVTHDQEEAFEVADRVVIMNKGCVEQAGTPQEIFEQPANPFVMDFLATSTSSMAGCTTGVPSSQPQRRVPGVHGTGVACGDRLRALARARHRARPQWPASVAGKCRPHQPGTPGGEGAAARGGVRHLAQCRPRMGALRRAQVAAGESVYVSPRRMRVFVQDYQVQGHQVPDYQI